MKVLHKEIIKLIEKQTQETISNPKKLKAWAEEQKKYIKEYEDYMNLENHSGDCYCARCMNEFLNK
jgi:hypothetical protein